MNNHQNNFDRPPKKAYTLEDNVKSISFGMRDIVKQFEELNLPLSQLLEVMRQKKDDDNGIPF